MKGPKSMLLFLPYYKGHGQYSYHKHTGEQEKNTKTLFTKVMDDPKQGLSEMKIKWPTENCPFSCGVGEDWTAMWQCD